MKWLYNFRKIFWHDLLGWHDCEGGDVEWNGQFKGRCSCGDRVLRDHHRNWFSIETNEPLAQIIKRMFRLKEVGDE